jgi:polyisoprenoid-binding protein YceI
VAEGGTYTLGPDDARLTVRTGRTGAIAKAGHDLLIEVTQWSATLRTADPAALELTADSTSMRVLEGTGGIQALDKDDKANIEQTIDDEVLKGGTISFHSTSVSGDDRRLDVGGELELGGKRAPVSFRLAIGDDGSVNGEATFKQTDFGMKPYSALFGTLKVADEVRVEVDGRLPTTEETVNG